MSWFSRIANALRSDRSSTDLADELRFHLDRRAADLIRGGVPPAEAERIARRQLGNPLQLRESSRDVKSAVWLESLLQDFRLGLRITAKHRKASLAAIISLALAIGACTAAFALADALIFRPLPVPAPKQLIDLPGSFQGFSDRITSRTNPHPSAMRNTGSFATPLAATRIFSPLFPACNCPCLAIQEDRARTSVWRQSPARRFAFLA